jgi:hypothetical protein
VKKPVLRTTAAAQKARLEAWSEEIAETVGTSLTRELATVPREEKRAWVNRWLLRRFGPSSVAAGVCEDDDAQ